jgi:nitrite reductase (NADH) small subunit
MAETVTANTVNLGHADAIPLGQGRCFVVGGEEIAVFRQRDGRLFAIQNRCPHRQGPLSEGMVGGNRVICPLHAHQFSLESGRGTEGGECVRAFTVQEAGGRMVLQL